MPDPRTWTDPAPLVIRDQPSAMWLLSALFAGVGAAFVYLGLFHHDQVPAYAGALALAGGLIAMATGIWSAWRSPLSIVRAGHGELTVTRVGLIGRRVERLATGDVRAVAVERDRDSDGDPVARPIVLLRSGRTLLLSMLWRHDTEAVADLARRLADALGVDLEPA